MLYGMGREAGTRASAGWQLRLKFVLAEKFGLLASALPLLSSWAARLLPEPRMSGTSPEQESPVQSPACSDPPT